ncbi:hypothetical protein CEJ45_23810 [Herbaspirillum aquaticum]|uniref:Uncharacterized protein n=2 Tax=Herbaspirillum aquaticum TaxID=568783 RepID=A0A225SLR4_9BURK|nr:hypothetical protein CEJ45_23810 [Herbaspirillum aquaticum]
MMSATIEQIAKCYLVLLTSLASSAERGEPIGDLPQVIANLCAKRMYEAGANELEIEDHFGARIKTYLDRTPECKKRYRSVLETAHLHILICTTLGQKIKRK